MKQHYRYNYILYLLVMSFAFSCKQKETQPDLDAIETAMGKEEAPAAVDSSIQTAAEEANEALIRECTTYLEEWEKLNATKAAFYTTVVLPKALANPELPEQNRVFLLALETYLNQSVEEARAVPTTEQLLFPIFKLEEKELGIFGFPAYDHTNESFIDISAENKILTSSRLTATIDSTAIDKVVFHTELADSLFRNTDQTFTAFTTGRKVQTKVVNFGSYAGECLEYYNYLIDSQPFKATDKVLFGSRYNLDLTYKHYPAIDAQLQRQVKKECEDCPNSREQEKTFAALKGVDDIYFTYADTFPLNNELETPLRGLVMKMGSKIVYLWYAEVDLFGCSCL
ncbi:hypothetical protein DXT99_14920 [Pontibacter diazotrophicus]|uniref:Lipoprotein n=1 Tax=Pontibacter diazotrophicus TaxID=1400979 RepID=A0A3D8LAJ9_9BACT|nr:hypothetical protein [Pontibacter diazotrophicus]RDV14410.1 hypothetical protein DXT99_14920 [Pontibacter diazotrophicus]